MLIIEIEDEIIDEKTPQLELAQDNLVVLFVCVINNSIKNQNIQNNPNT